jgi:hypothetical protein
MAPELVKTADSVPEFASAVRNHRALLQPFLAAEQAAAADRKSVENAADRVAARDMMRILKGIPIEELNRGKGGIRVKTLRDCGFETLADAYAATPARLEAVKGISAEEADTILNKQSGLLGVSGISSDCRDVDTAAKAGNKRAQLALDILVHNIKKIIGSYIAEMNGVDALVFTAGIGENDPELREAICSDLEFLGIEINKEVNAATPRGTAADITKAGAKVHTYVIPTDEEYMIALDTQNLTK